jgi:hypothetical protein
VLLTAGSEALGIDGEDALRGPHSSGRLRTGDHPITPDRQHRIGITHVPLEGTRYRGQPLSRSGSSQPPMGGLIDAYDPASSVRPIGERSRDVSHGRGRTKSLVIPRVRMTILM